MTGLCDVAKIVSDYVDKFDRPAFRETSRELRVAADELFSALKAETFWTDANAIPRGQTADAAIASVAGIVKRRGGVLPQKLTVALKDTSATTALLASIHSGVGARARGPGLQDLEIMYVAVDPGLAAAVHAAAPALTSLRYSYYGAEPAQRGLLPMLSGMSSSLTSLRLDLSDGYNIDELESLGKVLCACTILRHLELNCALCACEDGVLPIVAKQAEQLRALSSLRLEDIYTMEQAAAVGCFTQLTSLCISFPWRVSNGIDFSAESMELVPRMAAAVLQPMSSLVELVFGGGQLQLVAAHLPPTLTSLDFTGSIQGFSGPLPAALRTLRLRSADDSDAAMGFYPDELLSLQLPAGLTRLTLDALACDRHPLEALLAAARLVGRLHDKEDVLHLAHHWNAPLDEVDHLGQVFKVLERPLGEGLRRLEVKGCDFEMRDVVAMVKHLPDLEELTLHCMVHPMVVAVLSSLPRLRTLVIRLDTGSDADVDLGVDREVWTAQCIAAGLAPLLLCAPSLRRVRLQLQIDTLIGEDDQLRAEVHEGVELVRSTLRKVGRDPRSLECWG